MNKYNNPRLLNTVVSGTGMKHPMLPHVVVGDTANGFIRGDLMDANAIVELVNNIIGGAPDTLDTLKEAADRIAALEHDTQDYQVGDTLASKVWNTMRGLQAVVVGNEPAEELAIVLNWNNTVFDPHDEGRYGSLEIGVATSQKPGLMSTADKAALGAASAASALIPQIMQTIEDNELTVAAALNDLNSRILELAARLDALDGGGSSSGEVLQDGLYKILTPGETWICFRASNGRIMVYASSTTGSDNINTYDYINGTYYYSTAEDTYLDLIRTIAEKYTNFVDVSKEQHLHTAGEQLSDWNSYVEFL